MNFKLTFNRPAVRQFIEGGDGHGLKIKIENGVVMFMPSPTKNGEDVASLVPRTRGGYESIVEGSGAAEVLKTLQNAHGPFFVLRRVGKDWVAAEPYKGKDAPPKFEPHVRVWHSSQPKSAKPTASKARRAATATPTPQAVAPESVNIGDRVRWAYSKLNEAPRPGRPSREITEARAIKDSFEATAMEFLSGIGGGPAIDVKAAIEAYNQLGSFLRTVAPEALLQGQPAVKTAKVPTAKTPTAKAPVAKTAKAKAKAPKATAKAAAPAPAAKLADAKAGKSDDEESEGQVREAMKKLGLEEKPAPVSKRIRGPVNTRAFGGERLIA